MTELKLKNNVMQLVCRTCLKMEKVRFNIFQHLQNNKLISDLIMEYTPIKVQKDDGFPINICSNCIKKLNLTSDFIAMAVQSDVKLQKFYRSKRAKMLHIKSEQADSMLDYNIENDNVVVNNNKMCSPENYDSLNIQTESIKPETCISNSNEQFSELSDQWSDSSIDNNCSSLEVSADSEKPAVQDVTMPERIYGSLHQNELDKEMQEQSDNTVKYLENKGEDESVIEHKEILPDEKIQKLQKPQKCNNSAKRNVRTNRRAINTRLNDPRNVNEKQAELLDNPDYKRIMEMGLSKKEKARQPVFCKDCNKTFTFQYFVGIHAHLHTGNLPFKCEKCGARFPKKPVLNQHLRTHIETKDFSCEECGKAFTTIYCLRLHKLVHSNEKPHKCDICNKAFRHGFTLRNHLKIHNNEKNHICEVCGKTFVDISNLANHRIMHTTSEDKNFPCEICGKRFALKRSLRAHMNTHSSEKPHVCNHCGRSFKKHVILQRHVLIHTGEKPHECEVCGKKFRQRSCIGRHMRIHTGETPFPCELCTATFKYKHHLLNHMRIHTKESGHGIVKSD